MSNVERVLRRPDVESRTGYSRSSIYLGVKNGTFPKPIKLGKRAVGWIESEIDAWLADKVKARDGLQERPVRNTNG